MSDSNGNATAAAVQQAATNISNYAYDASASRKQNKRQIEFWNLQNEYNSPKAQMQRLQEAGLNPNLIYGDSVSGATGRADSLGTPDKPDGRNPLSDISVYQNLRTQRAQADLLEAQVTTEAERQRLTSNQADKTFFDAANNNFANIENPFVTHTLEGMQRKNQLLKQQTIGKQIDNDIKDATKAQAVKSIFWRAEGAESQYKGRELQNRLLELQKEFLSLGLDRNSPWYAKIFGNVVRINK